jgi:hypothetical protein
MICQFVCEAVLSHSVTEGGKSVKIAFQSGEDTVNLVVPTPDLDNLIDKLANARATAGVQQSDSFQLRLPKTFAVGPHPDAPGIVALTFDMSLPSRIGFGIGSQNARAIAQEMTTAARKAEGLKALAEQTKPPALVGFAKREGV